jgi:hypothetical protein
MPYSGEPGDPEMTMRWRMIMRAVLLAGLVGFATAIVLDRPNGSVPAVPLVGDGGTSFYTRGVWLGVESQSDFVDTDFTISPSLVVGPEGAGWRGRLIFQIRHLQPADLKGTFVLALPKTSAVQIHQQHGLVEPYVSHGDSRTLYYLRISARANMSVPFNASVPISWTTPGLTQQVGFGSNQYELFISNAFTAKGGIYATLPFISSKDLSVDGLSTDDTPAATLTVSLPAGDTITQLTPASDIGFQTPTQASWDVAPPGASLQPGTFAGRVIVLTIQNTTAQFLYEVLSGAGFAVFGFVLAEMTPFTDDIRKLIVRARGTKPNVPSP